MLGELKCLENIDLSDSLDVNYACDYSADHRIAIITNAGCYVLHLAPNRDYTWPVFSIHKLFIPLQDFNLSESINLNFENILEDLPKELMYEGIMRADISSGDFFSPMEKTATLAKWSPLGILDNSKSILAVLASTGSLCLYVRIMNESLLADYKCVWNFTEEYINLVKNDWKLAQNAQSVEVYMEMKKRCSQVKPVVFAWSKLMTVENRNFCYLSIGHENGDVAIWRINEMKSAEMQDFKIIFVTKIETNQSNLTALHWQQFGNSALITTGYLNGILLSTPIKDIKSATLHPGAHVLLWANSDELRIQYITSIISDKKMYIIAVKGHHIIIYLIDNKANVLDICKFNVGNYLVTDIKKIDKNRLLILLATGQMQEIVLSYENGKIQLVWKFIYVNLNWSFKKTSGLIVSPNKMLVGILTTYCRTLLGNRDERNITLSLFSNMAVDPSQIIMNSTSNTLINYWDCLETIRVTSLQEKKKLYDFHINNYSDLPLVQIKALCFITKVMEVMFDQVLYVDTFGLELHENVQRILKIKLAVKHLYELLAKLDDRKRLSKFQYQSMNLLNEFLKQQVLNDAVEKLKIDDDTVQDMFNVIAKTNELEYPEMPLCYFCKESISGLCCVPPHYDVRCAITLMQVDMKNCYICPLCKCKVHKEIEAEQKILLCPYCDASLEELKVEM